MKTLWQKGEEAGQQDWFNVFTASEDRLYDADLIPYDLKVNQAQARMLRRAGLFNEIEEQQTLQELDRLEERWRKGAFQLEEDDEDVHSAVEKALIERLGDTGKKIHTGRSRNDQVLTDMRLYLKDRLEAVRLAWVAIGHRLDELASEYNGVFFAGTTHMQPAMPTSADAWAAGYLELLLQDLESLTHAERMIDCCPLGSAAGYGVPHIPVDRELLARELGFDRVQEAVASAQLSRGLYEKRAVDALGYGAMTFNRMAGDIIGFVSSPHPVVRLSDEQCSGSSIMPQKRNPDAWELIRAESHEFSGYSAHLTGLTGNLASGYHRDLQVVKKVVMQACKRAEKIAGAVQYVLAGLSFDAGQAEKTLTPPVFATHEANRVVMEGVPFRDAYRRAGSDSESLQPLSPEQLKASYAHQGAPGRYESDRYRSCLERYRQPK